MRLFLTSILVLLCLMVTGCNKDQTDASQILPGICDYFPGSVMYAFDKRVLWIQTKVDGISGSMAEKIYAEACQKAVQVAQDKIRLKGLKITIAEEMNFDQHSFLIIGFRGGIVAWAVQDGMDANGTPRSVTLSWQQGKAWLHEHIGYVPTPDQIHVITKEAAQNTPKGQEMQLQTLAQIQSELKQHQQEQIKDLIRKQEFLQSP